MTWHPHSTWALGGVRRSKRRGLDRGPLLLLLRGSCWHQVHAALRHIQRGAARLPRAEPPRLRLETASLCHPRLQTTVVTLLSCHPPVDHLPSAWHSSGPTPLLPSTPLGAVYPCHSRSIPPVTGNRERSRPSLPFARARARSLSHTRPRPRPATLFFTPQVRGRPRVGLQAVGPDHAGQLPEPRGQPVVQKRGPV